MTRTAMAILLGVCGARAGAAGGTAVEEYCLRGEFDPGARLHGMTPAAG